MSGVWERVNEQRRLGPLPRHAQRVLKRTPKPTVPLVRCLNYARCGNRLRAVVVCKGRRKQYCSPPCYHESLMLALVECPVDGTLFRPLRINQKRQQTCSVQCRSALTRGIRRLGTRWSIKYEQCGNPWCTTPESPHGGRGWCRRCCCQMRNRKWRVPLVIDGYADPVDKRKSGMYTYNSEESR